MLRADDGEWVRYGDIKHLLPVQPKAEKWVPPIHGKYEIFKSVVFEQPAADEFSAEINALPDRLRRFIRDLELRMDPAGDVRRAYIAEMKAEGLAAKLEECLIRLDSTRRTLP